MSEVELDAIDRRIIAVLQAEGRISNLELAERIGLSPTPCSRRLKRLEESGVIAGYGARINPAALGLSHGHHVLTLQGMLITTTASFRS